MTDDRTDPTGPTDPGAHGVLRLDRLVPGTPERVWRRWTTEEGLATWWWSHWPGTTYAVDLRVGGRYRIEAAEQGVGVTGEYVVLEPHERLVTTWTWLDDGEPGPDEQVEVTFAAEADGTRVTVEHTGPWSTPAPAEDYRQGWEFVLAALERTERAEQNERGGRPRDKHDQPSAAPPVVDRAAFDDALAEQVVREKELTRHGDRVSAARRRLPRVQVEDYVFDGTDGPVRLSELFGDHYLLLVQNVMFDPSWEEGCPSCTWAVDNLPARMSRLAEEGIAFAMVSQAPVDKLEDWRARQGWEHTWVSSGATTYHHDWGWTRTDDEGREGQLPGYSYYLLEGGTPYLTYMTTARGTEAILPVAHVMDRTCYGRQQDWEDSPEGWPQLPTYG